jgi:hypothetical protein
MISRLAAMITTPIACASLIRACHVIPFDGYAGAGRWP